MRIKEIMSEINKINHEKGFWEDKNPNFAEKVMLVVTELSEAVDAYRKSSVSDMNFYNSEKENFGEDKDIMIQAFQEHIKDTVEDEFADAVIRIFDLCEQLGIDLETHIRLKIDYNKTRPYKHNKKY